MYGRGDRMSGIGCNLMCVAGKNGNEHYKTEQDPEYIHESIKGQFCH